MDTFTINSPYCTTFCSIAFILFEPKRDPSDTVYCSLRESLHLSRYRLEPDFKSIAPVSMVISKAINSLTQRRGRHPKKFTLCTISKVEAFTVSKQRRLPNLQAEIATIPTPCFVDPSFCESLLFIVNI